MKTTKFQFSPDFNSQIMNKIKKESIRKQNEVRQLWRFSLITAASAALVAIIFLTQTPKQDLASDLDLVYNFDEISLSIDYLSIN